MSPRSLLTATIVAVLLLVTLPVPASAGAETWYLTGSSAPSAGMSSSPPPGGGLPNYDPGRDGEPGLLLERSNRGASETDPARYQEWRMDASGLTVSVNRFQIWAAPKGFESSSQVVFAAYLMDCATDCEVLDAKTATTRGGADWRGVTIPLIINNRVFDDGHSLVVKITVLGSSESDMRFAYGTSSFPAHLQVNTKTTAVTTTTTTTTTIPTTTTTSTGESSTSTTTAGDGVTTTTAPADTGTTATEDRSETDPGPATTTSTTLAPEPELPVFRPTIFDDTDVGSGSVDDVTTINVFRTVRELEPAEGLAVAFATVAENIGLYWQAAVGTGGVASILLWIGLKRRQEIEESDSGFPSES